MNETSKLSFLYQEGTKLDSVIEALPQSAGELSVGGLVGSSPGWLSAYLASKIRVQLVVVRDQNTLYDFCEDLHFFLNYGLGMQQTRILPFPHLETLPYETKAPETSIEVERAEVFKALLAPSGEAKHITANNESNNSEPLIIVTPIRSLQRRLPPSWLVKDVLWILQVGSRVDRDKLSKWADQEGYERRDLVSFPGHYSVRGGIVDLFAFSHELPIRIEFFGDEIESIRLFDPMTQRSVKSIQSVHLVPLGRENLAVQAWRSGQPLDSLLGYIPQDSLIVIKERDSLERESDRVMDLVVKMYHQTEMPGEQQVGERIPPESLYGDFLSIEEELREFSVVNMTAFRAHDEDTVVETDIDFSFRTLEFGAGDHKARLKQLAEKINEGLVAAISCDNLGQQERLEELLHALGEAHEKCASSSDQAPERVAEPHARRCSPAQKDLSSEAFQRLSVLVGELHHGFSSPENNWALLTDREIFRRYKRIRAPRHAGLGVPIRDVLELKPEDYVVHEEHGIGQFMKLSRIDVEGKEGEFIELRFADEGKLYLPVENVHLVGRYIAGSDQPPKLSKLGSKAWENTKGRAQKAIEEMATELIELYAKRQVAAGLQYQQDTAWQREFEASFVYNETPDQLRSIEEVKKDMQSEKPMDRLLCGDVGFGKTEVALRAAFKAIMEGKQVAVLVPTTILAQQHYRTFSERMMDYPIEVRDLSRFRSAKEQKETVKELAQGKTDVVVGTHRLLSQDVKFKDLGLLIVDEEQRFGVKHKERLKQLKTAVDVLTLTATPIPRTLYLSLSGLRDMSQLSIPPEDRLPVLTYVVDFKPSVIEAAILREMARGGQVYFLHNRVKNIGAMADFIRRLVPDARVAVGHGQMPEKHLERLMLEFIDGQYDVLVCTTIIESGLDIPNVNTILINRADTFGLSDLYQLRGRVGRERHQAYCYLLVPSKKVITAQARERLLALQEFWKLGEGLNIALRDMEIRGTGNLLGSQQHGHIAAIGFDLYNKMLKETVQSIHSGKKKKRTVDTVLESGNRGELSSNYIESARQRLALYKRLAGVTDDKDLDDFRDEIRDLYGPLPVEAERLFQLRKLKTMASHVGIEYVNIGKSRARFRFADQVLKNFDPTPILQMAKQSPSHIEMSTVDGLSLVVTYKDVTEEQFLEHLQWIVRQMDKQD